MYPYALPAFLLGCLAWSGDGPFLAVLAAIFVGLLFRRSRGLALVALVASPCIAPAIFGAGRAISGWWDGAATEWERGGRHPYGHADLDAVGRFYPVAIGNDLVSVSELMGNISYDSGYNGTLYLWTRIAGPPTGAYTGAFPERAEVLASFEQSSFRMNPAAIQDGLLLAPGESIRFKADTVREDLRPTPYSLATVHPDWIALTDSNEGWPGMVVIARSSGAPILYLPLGEAETTSLRRRWRLLGQTSPPSPLTPPTTTAPDPQYTP